MVDQTADPVLVAVGDAHQITVYAERYLTGDMTRAALIDAMRPAVDMLTCVLPAIPLGPETLEPRKRLAGADARVPKGYCRGTMRKMDASEDSRLSRRRSLALIVIVSSACARTSSSSRGKRTLTSRTRILVDHAARPVR
jgi:hypothetical protein